MLTISHNVQMNLTILKAGKHGIKVKKVTFKEP